MLKLTRAVVIRRKILNYPDESWEFAYQNDVMRLALDGNGWRALIWANLPDPASSADSAEERRLFLEKCRKQACPYMLNVCCENQGEVLSLLSRTRALKIFILRRGKWEEHFGLRPPGYQKKLSYGFVGAMCLTMAPETFHHWQIFAQGEAGVCIIFDRARLEAHLAGQSFFIPRAVEYVQLKEIGSIDASDIHRLPFLKRYGFRDEREYRLLGFAPDERPSLSISIIPDLIQRVMLSPFTHPNILASLQVALRALPLWRNLRVGRSSLTSNENWQKALGNVIGRHSSDHGSWIPSCADSLLSEDQM